jgi:hypothetical protein
MSQVVPPTYQLLSAEHNGPNIEFTIPVISEDAGDELWALTWINWGLEGEESINTKPLGPDPNAGMGGAGPKERPVYVSWRPDARVEPGCNQLTIFVVNERYADLDADVPTDFNKAAMITWWVNVDPPTGLERDLIDCPGPRIPILTGP